ncbi:MAG TPA: hypothetical protein PLI09_01835 [Candidatus Hydrogenedentes bacterium]|nr:hypothetical protein [Candidatus Hydrogenedentota bacterium]
MNDLLDDVRNLAVRARLEEAPRGHVARKVILHLQEKPATISRPLAVLTILAATIAVVSLALEAALTQLPVSDPLGAFFQVASLM